MMQLIGFFKSNFYLNMFRASLCPSSEAQDSVLLHLVFCTGFAGCGCVELGRKLCALCEGYCSTVRDRSLIINMGLVASSFISLHPKFVICFDEAFQLSGVKFRSFVPNVIHIGL